MRHGRNPASDELARLMTGNDAGVEGTQAMCMVHPSTIPTDKSITYTSVICDFCPLKTEQHRCRSVVCSDKLPYSSDSAALAANLVESKILCNSTISQQKASFMTVDISNFFLLSVMHDPEFMKIHQNDIPSDIYESYNSNSDMDMITDLFILK